METFMVPRLLEWKKKRAARALAGDDLDIFTSEDEEEEDGSNESGDGKGGGGETESESDTNTIDDTANKGGANRAGGDSGSGVEGNVLVANAHEKETAVVATKPKVDR